MSVQPHPYHKLLSRWTDQVRNTKTKSLTITIHVMSALMEQMEEDDPTLSPQLRCDLIQSILRGQCECPFSVMELDTLFFSLWNAQQHRVLYRKLSWSQWLHLGLGGCFC
jgi:hypothetical protein